MADWNHRHPTGVGSWCTGAGGGTVRTDALPGAGGHVIDRGWDEIELVRRCKEGSEAAYAELVRRHRPRLYALAYRMIGDRETAEDVVQETFLAAFRSIERFEPKPSLAPWLNTILLRLAGRASGRRRTRPRTSLDRATSDGDGVLALGDLVEADASADPHAAAEAAELRQALTKAIAGLPFHYRAAVVLRYVVGLEYEEAAASLDVPLNTFKSHLLRGTRQLRDALTAQLEVPIPPVGPVLTTTTATAATAAASGNGHAVMAEPIEYAVERPVVDTRS